MTRWEYLTTVPPTGTAESAGHLRDLNARGEEGWEFVAVYSHLLGRPAVLLWKRPAP
jgi:hypothetical protein